MLLKKQALLLYVLLSGCLFCNAQIEIDHVSLKEFKQTGFGAFLNFSVPVSDANYITLEGGLQYYQDKYTEDLAMIPVLIGYRYTLNQSGTGLYAEPNAGYTFGSSTIQEYDANNSPISDGDHWAYEKVAGPCAGINIGYLFEPSGIIQFNIALRYEHSFGNFPTNVIGLRIAHAFTFGRRNN